ncbi:YbaB/EbfC family nucleoid-associated protein [Actinoplanes sp. NPDC051343]|uniref:YbaB/EbfC family nucleoid-associated protein n=1 Tax=Actinoplanes sp. NPDC051343 TaxID=3363906 RepID=UPI0037AEC844
MTDALFNHISQLQAEIEKQREAAADLNRDLGDTRHTVVAKNRAVSVTVNGRGELAEVRFPISAYRSMAPAELGDLLVTQVAEAQRRARTASMQRMTGLLPSGLGSLSGTGDLDTAIGDVTKMFGDLGRAEGDRPQ